MTDWEQPLELDALSARVKADRNDVLTHDGARSLAVLQRRGLLDFELVDDLGYDLTEEVAEEDLPPSAAPGR